MKLAPRRAMTSTPGCVLRPVVALDIDGTSGYYHEHFTRFLSQWLQRPMSGSWTGEVPFYRWLGVSKRTYRQIKLSYRQGGMKRSMPVVPGAAAFTRAVRAAGADLWVCTTRPYLRHDNIDPDTRFWLRHHGMQYDGVLFGPDKYRDLVRMVGIERVVAVLDDEPEQCERATRLGLPVRIIDRLYNRNTEFYYDRCVDMKSAEVEIIELVKKWRAERGV